MLTPTRPRPPVDDLAPLRQPLVERLLRRAPAGELLHPPAVPGLMLARIDHAEDMVCSVYQPCVVLVVQGRKRVTIGDQTLHYDPQHYFVTPLELPSLATILDASPQAPFLSMALQLDLRLVASMVLEGVASPAPPDGGERRAMSTGRLDAPLLDAFGRLLALVEEPSHAPVLAPLVQREITYRLLTGEAGWRLRQIAAVDSQGHQVSRAIDLLKRRFTEALRIEDLARAAHMSVSSLHHHFKALTGMSPLQFQKQLRLAEARRLMLGERLDAASAAYRVGYESPSQFSREYSRHFGAPPVRDIARLRELADARASDG
jgi:AraC-like DNA-binding protein